MQREMINVKSIFRNVFFPPRANIQSGGGETKKTHSREGKTPHFVWILSLVPGRRTAPQRTWLQSCRSTRRKSVSENKNRRWGDGGVRAVHVCFLFFVRFHALASVSQYRSAENGCKTKPHRKPGISFSIVTDSIK